jgi:hypothetical protein
MIKKNALIDGAYYEGVEDGCRPCVAVWNAARNMFFTNEYSWDEVVVLPMTYHGEPNEYWGQFTPLIQTEPRKFEIVDSSEINEEAV